MSRRYTIRSKEEKLEIVKQVLAGAPERAWESQGIHRRQVHDWTKLYLEKGSSCKVARVYDDAGRETTFTYHGDLLAEYTVTAVHGNQSVRAVRKFFKLFVFFFGDAEGHPLGSVFFQFLTSLSS